MNKEVEDQSVVEKKTRLDLISFTRRAEFRGKGEKLFPVKINPRYRRPPYNGNKIVCMDLRGNRLSIFL